MQRPSCMYLNPASWNAHKRGNTVAETAIQLKDVYKQFLSPSNQAFTALREINLTVERGEFCAVVGPSGAGKSTILSLISGLDRPSRGEVFVNDEPVRQVRKDVGYMFQSDAVFPWKSVLQNVAIGAIFHGMPTATAQEEARNWLGRVGLKGFEHYYPHQLSGGMRKRLALAQTFITGPKVLLMDEPFSALDVQTRALMEDELLFMWGSMMSSVVFVTHDLEEAIALADRVVVLTASPATIKGIFKVDLPRPRNVTEIRFNPNFVDLYQKIWESLRTEVKISYERSKQKATVR